MIHNPHMLFIIVSQPSTPLDPSLWVHFVLTASSTRIQKSKVVLVSAIVAPRSARQKSWRHDRPEKNRGATIFEFSDRGATIGQKKIVAPRSGVWG